MLFGEIAEQTRQLDFETLQPLAESFEARVVGR
jgi:hypothetical protein